MNPFCVKRQFPIFGEALTRKNNGAGFMFKFVTLEMNFFTIWLLNCRISNILQIRMILAMDFFTIGLWLINNSRLLWNSWAFRVDLLIIDSKWMLECQLFCNLIIFLGNWLYKKGLLCTSHSAYVPTATESVGVKINGLLPPNFL